MPLVRFEPAKTYNMFSKKMNEFFSDFDKGLNIEFGNFSPRVDIHEDESNLFLHVELPGINKEDVKVTINEENVITIKGEKKHESNDEKKECCYIRVERNYGNFTRSFMLPDNINAESINAKFENGVLSITLGKKEPEKPKEISVDIK